MVVSRIYINTYRYDFAFARICISSIRYWYPGIPIVLIKDESAGSFDTSETENSWNVSVFSSGRKKFGWGYGKLEPLFCSETESFLVLDADTLLVGPVLDAATGSTAHFVVDEEVQPAQRLREIYYDPENIKKIDASFSYPGYSFNTGQWFGTSGILHRDDFNGVLDWSVPPVPKFPRILFNGEQGILNFIVQLKQQQGRLAIERKKIMIWPEGSNAGFIDLDKIRSKQLVYPYVIHWAGMRFRNMDELPRYDIIRFFLDHYYSVSGRRQAKKDSIHNKYLLYEKDLRKLSKKIKRKIAGK